MLDFPSSARRSEDIGVGMDIKLGRGRPLVQNDGHNAIGLLRIALAPGIGERKHSAFPDATVAID
jgi:hypothetical protein